MKIIGVCGLAGSGKDTVADYLVAKHNYTKVSFAAILKDMLRVAGLPEPTNRDDKEKIIEGFNFSWRHAAQTLGTEYGRVCLGENIWIDLTMKSLREDGKYVVSDVRFENEATAIRNVGNLIHLKGRGANLGELSAHASEAGVAYKSGDVLISNDSSMELLYAGVELAL